VLTLRSILRRARSRLDDTRAPYLWSDDELLDYTNDTIRDAAIRASLTVQDDNTIVFTQNTDLTWKAKYPLPSGYLDVKSVRLASNPNIVLSRSSMRRYETRYQGRPTETGTPTCYMLDKTQAGTGDDYGLQVRTITFVATPDAADTAYLDVVRLPELLDLGDLDGVPEIDEIYHPDLLHGITGLAYLKRDSDTFDPKKSARDMVEFTRIFGERIPASVMRERQTDVPLEMYVE
jgi:hypothetical protein